jgi:acyl carrier protein
VTIQERVRDFILEYFYVSDPDDLTDEVSLLDSGYVDSTGMLEIILFLEGEYAIHIEDHETIPDNLESISQIAAFVARKQPKAADRVGGGSGAMPVDEVGIVVRAGEHWQSSSVTSR